MRDRDAAPIAILALVVMAATPVRSQGQKPALERGSMLIGGNASFTIQKDDFVGEDYEAESRTSFSLSPSLLYFVAPGFALGGEVQFARSSQGGLSTTSYGIGPALAYYFVRQSDVHPFGMAVGLSVFIF